MKFVYGPVFSKRLGWSLGIDPVPSPKTCNFNCIFCQLGQTKKLINQRQDFYPLEEILEEFKSVKDRYTYDVVGISGSGEPLLYKSIGKLVRGLKSLTGKPVALLTHSPFIYITEIRREILNCDIFLPSLDAGDEETFLKINRPFNSIKFKDIVNGLIAFRKEFKGKFYLEIMVIKGINDGSRSISKIKELTDKISPDLIHINIPTRPSATPIMLPSYEDILRIRSCFNESAEIVADPYPLSGPPLTLSEILDATKRHPLSLNEIQLLTGLSEERIQKYMEKHNMKPLRSAGNVYYISE